MTLPGSSSFVVSRVRWVRRSRALFIVALLAFGWATMGISVDAVAQDSLSSVGAPEATPTFESIGIIMPFEGDDNRTASCTVEYRPVGAPEWREGHELWVDHRTDRRDSREFRGSLVHLHPGTEYEIRLTYTDPDGGDGTADLTARTWSENFPEGEITEVADQSETLVINESGTPDAYRVYQSPEGARSTIDVDDNHDNTIVIDANYVIVRKLDLTGASEHAIVLTEGVHDVVLEDLDITNWGPEGIGRTDERNYNWRQASGIYADGATERVVIQHNQIHHPRGGANSWEDGSEVWQTGQHPAGPQGISFDQYRCSPCSGNHVIRYNRIFSEGRDHYFNDGIGGAANGTEGNLYRDSDVYGNIVSHVWDDGLEIEGYNINVRIWGNVIHTAMKGIATANIGNSSAWGEVDNSLGPHYIWRNLIMNTVEPYRDATKHKGNGGYFFYNNTLINTGGGVAAPRNDTNTDYTQLKFIGAVKNNLILSGAFRSNPDDLGDSWMKWDFDYNLYGSDPTSLMNRLGVSGWEANGILGATPTFDIEGDYLYFLAADDPGVDAGIVIPNFSDRFSGAAPDLGAFERGVFPAPDRECAEGQIEVCGDPECPGARECIDGDWSDCEGMDESCESGMDGDMGGTMSGSDPDAGPDEGADDMGHDASNDDSGAMNDIETATDDGCGCAAAGSPPLFWPLLVLGMLALSRSRKRR